MIKKIKDFFKPKKPVRLSKQVTWQEKVQNFINRNYGKLLIIAIVLVLLIFVSFIICFFPGSESGLVYNNRTGGLI